jgi:hypothetical protein
VIPFAAAVVGGTFGALVLGQFAVRHRPYQLVWGSALAMFALAALVEALAGVWGWSPAGYRLYYYLGGICNVGWLGAGSLLLLFPRAGRIAVLIMLLLSLAAIPAVIVAPVRADLLLSTDPGRGVIGMPAVLFAPVVNTLGSAALIGGALWSAWGAWRRHAPAAHVLGMSLIAAGALFAALTHGLAGQVGGQRALAPLGELVGAALMFTGYLVLEARRRSAGQLRTSH